MSTVLQQNLAKEIINNTKRKKPRNKKEMLVSVGYKQSVAETKPNEIMESEGVKQALNDYGFNVDNAKKVVAEILLDRRVKPDTRINASKEIFKVHGSYEDTKNGANKTILINIPKEVAESYGINEQTGGSNQKQGEVQSA